jgi:hypothetical protein
VNFAFSLLQLYLDMAITCPHVPCLSIKLAMDIFNKKENWVIDIGIRVKFMFVLLGD